MAERRITNIRPNQEVRYLDETCIVVDVYPYIAYLRKAADTKLFCVNIGDLVISGLEPFLPVGRSSKENAKLQKLIRQAG